MSHTYLMAEYMDLKSTYNKIAEDWVNDHNSDTWWKEGVDTFLAQLPPNASVLDLGCGAGVKTHYIFDKGFEVTGIDFSEKMIGIAKRNLSHIHFDVVDIYELDAYSGTFDGVFAQAVLLHFPKNTIVKVLEKMKEKLHKNGLLYLAVKGIKEDGIEERIVKENNYGYEYERFFSYFTLDELKGYMDELQMDLVWESVTTIGRAHWIQIISKKKN